MAVLVSRWLACSCIASALVGASCGHAEKKSEEQRTLEEEARKGRLLERCGAGEEKACQAIGIGKKSSAESPTDASPDELKELDEVLAGAEAARQPDVEQRSPPRQTAPRTRPPIAKFPQAVAGFQFGSSKKEVRAACNAAGGKSGAVASDTLVCTTVPVDPLFNVDGAAIGFCDSSHGPRACEVHLMVRDKGPADVAFKLLEQMESKYGVARSVLGREHLCRGRDPRGLFRGTWLWKTKYQGKTIPIGYLVIGYHCTSVIHSPEVFLIYRDGLGIVRMFEQARKREQNY